MGPFFANTQNNDANINKHCLFHNEQDILTWLNDNDVILLDRGYRDAAPTMKMLGFHVAMPSFLNGKKQLTTEETNHSRCVTANRWVIESSEYLTDDTEFNYECKFFFSLDFLLQS